MKLLIADSGSTKTDWCVVEAGMERQRLTTGGTNPFFQTEEEIGDEIAASLLPALTSSTFDRVCFYGAGVAFPDKVAMLRRVLEHHLRVNHSIEVGSDLLAAARALCGTEPGIACIIGTGSNSCFYDGREIVHNVSPLGYVLGDEGSGAYLGKMLAGDVLKNQTSPQLKEAFLQEYHLTTADIIERVYRQPFPNRFLASLSPFVAEHIDYPEMHRLALDAFKKFFVRNVMQYDYRRYPANFVGSIAFSYKEVLRQAADETGVAIGTIVQSPMERLIAYHKNEVDGKE
ncbi:MAG: ATPase [Mediterranea sp.]|jgi:N-acetylglucosamine kinase-like BadF-type ATPase|nr:ATPase [Mediterranea sp.]